VYCYVNRSQPLLVEWNFFGFLSIDYFVSEADLHHNILISLLKTKLMQKINIAKMNC
jgi:hypothetical protein